MCYKFEGMLSAWDTRQNKCFMHWEADIAEIGKKDIVSIDVLLVESAPTVCFVVHVCGFAGVEFCMTYSVTDLYMSSRISGL